MAITDLTNTKWVLNSVLTLLPLSSEQYFEIDYITNNINCEYIGMNEYIPGNEAPAPHVDFFLIYYSNEFLVYEDGWENEAYRIIEITGGTDVTNSSLIAWLEANATQVPVANLSNTKWVFNSTIKYDSNFPTYTINYKAYYNNGANYETGTSLYMQNYSDRPSSVYGLLGNGLVHFSGVFFPSCIYEGNTTTMTPTSIEETLDYIEITGGTDVANPDLIAWLSQNATLQQPSVKTFDLSTLQLSAGTHTVQVKARAQGYRDSNFSNSVSYEVGPSLISFSIGGTTYQAEEGMTWAEWCDSEYNTGGFWYSSGTVTSGIYVVGRYTVTPTPTPIPIEQELPVSYTDLIIENENYTLIYQNDGASN